MTTRDEVRAAISDAYYDARNQGRTMEAAADDAADKVVALLEQVAQLGRRATLDPGAFVKRGPDNDGNAYGESLDRWQQRAIKAALGIEP